jgi:hypothetical protein
MSKTIIIIGLVITVVGIYIANSVWNEIQDQNNIKHSDYCNSWADRLDRDKANLQGDAVIAQLNSEINQYNHECTTAANQSPSFNYTTGDVNQSPSFN